uniref:Uncharacterized protein n=1 Tax=Poecilia latipinna TaxID=48699 RepID=A0A3B3UT39_9TELE
MPVRAVRRWWSELGPYFMGPYRDVVIGFGVMSVIFYRISYGGKLKVPPAHSGPLGPR